MQLRRMCVLIAGLGLLGPFCVLADDHQGGEDLVEQRRLTLWAAQTKNRDLVYSTYARIDHLRGTDPGSWVYEWSHIGEYFAAQGEAFAASDEPNAARDAFLAAAKYYGIARFPAKTLPGQLDAYHKHLQYYERAGEFFKPQLRVVEIPFEGRSIRGYLHLPQDVVKPPLILWNGGIDTWKGDAYSSFQPYIEAGFAVLSFDVLGTGESSDWAARPDSNRLHSAVIDYMQTYAAIDGRYIAHVGFSFSGYYAARNAITENRLFAVIAACAPIHDAWPKLYAGPWEIQEALSTAIHISRDQPDAIQQQLLAFSLIKQGLLHGPDSLVVPTLIVDGDLDNLVPMSDLHLLADSGRQTDLWIMGGDQHCFGQYYPVVMPKMAQWLTKKLAAKKATQ